MTGKKLKPEKTKTFFVSFFDDRLITTVISNTESTTAGYRIDEFFVYCFFFSQEKRTRHEIRLRSENRDLRNKRHRVHVLIKIILDLSMSWVLIPYAR